MTAPTERSVSAALRRAGFRKATFDEDLSSGEAVTVRAGFSAHEAVDCVVVRYWARGLSGHATPAQADVRASKLRAMEFALRGAFRVSGHAGGQLKVREAATSERAARKPNARTAARRPRSAASVLREQIVAARTPSDFERARLALRQAQRFAGLSQRDQFRLLGDLEDRERAARRARKPNRWPWASPSVPQRGPRRRVTGTKALGRAMRRFARGEDAVYAVSGHFLVGNTVTELSARAALEDLRARRAPATVTRPLEAAVAAAA